MLEPRERKIVEAVRRAHSISITIDGGFNQFSISTRSGKGDIRKFAHDIAIALQDYFNANGGRM